MNTVILKSKESKEAIAILAVDNIKMSKFAMELLKKIEDHKITHEEALEMLKFKNKINIHNQNIKQ